MSAFAAETLKLKDLITVGRSVDRLLLAYPWRNTKNDEQVCIGVLGVCPIIVSKTWPMTPTSIMVALISANVTRFLRKHERNTVYMEKLRVLV